MNLLLAYFDPSAGSLLLQALVGGASGIVVVGRYLWIQIRGQQFKQSTVLRRDEL